MSRRFEAYRQQDKTDCGAVCLKIIAKYYGKEYSLSELRERCHVKSEGSSLYDIIKATESLGFTSRGVMIIWDELKQSSHLPCIIYWEKKHFVVLYRIVERWNKVSVYVLDPACGRVRYNEEEFLQGWTVSDDRNVGIALLLKPNESFYDNNNLHDESKSGLPYIIKNYVSPYKRELLWVLFSILVVGLLSIVLPFITQSVVDKGVGTSDVSLVVVLLIAQLSLGISIMLNTIVRNRLLFHVTSRVNVSVVSDFLNKLMKLPISFCENRNIGDITQRIGDYGRIDAFLTGSLLTFIISAASLILYSIVIIGYNVGIFLVFITGSLIYLIWVVFFIERRSKLDSRQFKISSENQNLVFEMVSGMRDIKLNSGETLSVAKLGILQKSLFDIKKKLLYINQFQDVGNTFIDQLKNILITFLTAKAVIEGKMTLGMMMALQFMLGQINVPFSRLISLVESAQNASLSAHRLGEVFVMNDEEVLSECKIKSIPESVDIVFDNVSFGYGSSSLSLDSVSVRLPAGKVTALVGPSGSGKTTFIKMILGFYPPLSGTIMIGGNLLSDYCLSSWREACGSVLQDGYIFTDTIASNIALSETSPDLNKLRIAASVAEIDGWIDSLPLGYQTYIGQEGHGLSSGQRQRILIARAIYKRRKVFLFDEATNSLDATNERKIMENIQTIVEGNTVIISAHRLSTIKNADNIIVFDSGKVCEQGTHEQLIKAEGKYYELIRNQLNDN